MVNERLKALRDFMSIQKIDAFIIPSTDPHQSEYVADHWKLREYFSGFTGSAGTLIVTKDRAALWTDSRYFLQFEEECNTSEVQLHKQSIPLAPEHVAWLCSLLDTETCIGLDFRLFSISQINYLTSHTT
ncbi:aminopeptidase P family N-terminal domain-containing protein [Tenacibaculum sp.]|uniref:aminopeptidase P family N-terminal domain-containing protein n=1 Tax=Tenacibaculum sp. TaxID=1906242 RepID=UPI003AA876C9